MEGNLKNFAEKELRFEDYKNSCCHKTTILSDELFSKWKS